MSIAERQISRQLRGETIVAVYCPDTGDEPNFLALYHADNEIKPAFCRRKAIPRELMDDLVAQFTGEQTHNTDPEVIRSQMGMDAFFGRYYNSLRQDDEEES